MSRKPLSPSILVTLGLTATAAVEASCGPCLDIPAPNDTDDSGDTGDSGDSGDSGDTGDTGDTADSGDSGDSAEEEAVKSVLDRGVLPEDVAELVRQRRRDGAR